MRISEAIREGRKGKVQLRGKWFDLKNGVCAMGAAMQAVGEIYNIYVAFPQLIEKGLDGKSLYTAITERNDSGQTFEQIITWLESIGQ
jgi:hypothetical protein